MRRARVRRQDEDQKGDVVVVGIGNRWRGDDGIGCKIARLLQEQGWKAIDAEMVPENFLGVIARENPARVLLVDAGDFGGVAGEFRIFAADELGRLNFRGFSTHTLPLNMLAKLISSLCGARVWLLAVQPESVAAGEELSPVVEAALPQIIDFLRHWREKC